MAYSQIIWKIIKPRNREGVMALVDYLNFPRLIRRDLIINEQDPAFSLRMLICFPEPYKMSARMHSF